MYIYHAAYVNILISENNRREIIKESSWDGKYAD